MDVTKAIEPKSDQLNSDDLITGPITVTVKNTNVKESIEQPISIFYDGDRGKPYKPCKSMTRVLAHLWGKDSSKWVGRTLTLYRDPTVKWGGVEIGGIRISHMSHINGEETMALTATKGSRKLFTVKPLVTPKPADPALIQAGAKAAAEGVEKYTAWGKTLTPEQRALVKDRLAAWLDIAKKSDADEAAASASGA